MKTLFVLICIMTLAISDSFSQWTEQVSGVSTSLESVSVQDNNNAWICGASGKVLLTTNGGTNWNLTTPPNPNLELTNIWGVNSSTAFVTGTLPSPDTTYVFFTSDGGITWFQVFSQAGGFINGVSGTDTLGNIIGMFGNPIGGRWSLWISFDGGHLWDSTALYLQQSGSETGWSNSLYVTLLPSTNLYGWLGTNNSQIYFGINGQNWTAQPTTGISNIYSIFFKDSLNGFAGGNTGMAFTSNSGTNWVVNTSMQGTGNITGIAAYGSDIWYARGSSIFYSSDNGTSWIISTTQTGTYTHLSMPRAAKNNNIWAVRSDGGISKHSYVIGIQPVNNTVPKSFKLFQNYPNPFNPVTKIKFDIPKSSFTLIKIFDIIGREVATLVNEQLQAGTYETEWDASGYPSGVYFYKLSTNPSDNRDRFAGNIQVNKMILIK